MKSLIFYTGGILLLEYILGYGLAKKILPKSLTQYALLLAPWILNILIILVMVEGSLLGIPGKYIALGLTLLLCHLTWSERKQFRWRRSEMMFGLMVLGSVILNNSPLVLRDKFLTTISLGNNDVIAYASNADYLVDYSIRDSFRQKIILPVANLLQDGYRWGTPILQAFFLTIAHVPAWKVTYLLQTIIFATMLPLGYVLYRLWYDKHRQLAWMIPLYLAFNANLLYMLYHNFYGQVVFWGIELMIVLGLTAYFAKPSKKLELCIGGSIAAMYMAYHEPALFMLVPLVITAILSKNWQGLLRIAGITALLAGISVMNAVEFDFGQAFRANPNQPIGWQVFRSQSPMANPWEMLGLSSVHTAPPLPLWLAWTLSLVSVGCLVLGTIKSRVRGYTGSLMLFFALMFYWTSLGKSGNWFVFNRAYTYVLPLLIVVLLGGIAQIKYSLLRITLGLIALGLMITQGLRLNWKFVNSHLRVSAAYQTLSFVQKMNLGEPLYTLGMVSPYASIWDEVWAGYFLFPNIDNGTIPSQKITDGNLILLNKSTPWVRYPSYVLSDIVWENQFYRLGKICLSRSCLESQSIDLSRVVLGESESEDSLLGSGWSNPEKDGRWIEGRQATLTLVVGRDRQVTRLLIEARALTPETQLQIWVDGKSVGKSILGTAWQQEQLPILLSTGIHEITILSDRENSPEQLGNNDDVRKLSIRVRMIQLL